MKRYGEPVKPILMDRPYAMYIAGSAGMVRGFWEICLCADRLERRRIQELIARNVWTIPTGCTEPEYALSVHTIVDGKRVLVSEASVTDVCEGGILMYSQKDGLYYAFFRMKGTELELIEEIFQIPYKNTGGAWSRARIPSRATAPKKPPGLTSPNITPSN